MRFATIAVVAGSIAGCGSFGAADTPSASADGGPPADGGAPGNGGAPDGAAIPTVARCDDPSAVLVTAEAFNVLPPQGWTQTGDPALLSLDDDAEDVISAPTSFRAGVLAQANGVKLASLERKLGPTGGGLLCVTFQGRIDVGPEGFGSTSDDFVGFVGFEFRRNDVPSSGTSIGVALDAVGLRLHVRTQVKEDVTQVGVPFGTGVAFQRWTFVLDRGSGRTSFWIGRNEISLPVDLSLETADPVLGIGVAASGTVPEVSFHADDLRILLAP